MPVHNRGKGVSNRITIVGIDKSDLQQGLYVHAGGVTVA